MNNTLIKNLTIILSLFCLTPGLTAMGSGEKKEAGSHKRKALSNNPSKKLIEIVKTALNEIPKAYLDKIKAIDFRKIKEIKALIDAETLPKIVEIISTHSEDFRSIEGLESYQIQGLLTNRTFTGELRSCIDSWILKKIPNAQSIVLAETIANKSVDALAECLYKTLSRPKISSKEKNSLAPSTQSASASSKASTVAAKPTPAQSFSSTLQQPTPIRPPLADRLSPVVRPISSSKTPQLAVKTKTNDSLQRASSRSSSAALSPINLRPRRTPTQPKSITPSSSSSISPKINPLHDTTDTFVGGDHTKLPNKTKDNKMLPVAPKLSLTPEQDTQQKKEVTDARRARDEYEEVMNTYCLDPAKRKASSRKVRNEIRTGVQELREKITSDYDDQQDSDSDDEIQPEQRNQQPVTYTEHQTIKQKPQDSEKFKVAGTTAPMDIWHLGAKIADHLTKQDPQSPTIELTMLLDELEHQSPIKLSKPSKTLLPLALDLMAIQHSQLERALKTNDEEHIRKLLTDQTIKNLLKGANGLELIKQARLFSNTLEGKQHLTSLSILKMLEQARREVTIEGGELSPVQGQKAGEELEAEELSNSHNQPVETSDNNEQTPLAFSMATMSPTLPILPMLPMFTPVPLLPLSNQSPTMNLPNAQFPMRTRPKKFRSPALRGPEIEFVKTCTLPELEYKLNTDKTYATAYEGLLHAAIYSLEKNGDPVKKVDLLIKAGADCNAKAGGVTPLSRAVCGGMALRIFNKLLDSGANVFLPNDDGIYPIHIAIEKHHGPTVQTILNHNKTDKKKLLALKNAEGETTQELINKHHMGSANPSPSSSSSSSVQFPFTLGPTWNTPSPFAAPMSSSATQELPQPQAQSSSSSSSSPYAQLPFTMSPFMAPAPMPLSTTRPQMQPSPSSSSSSYAQLPFTLGSSLNIMSPFMTPTPILSSAAQGLPQPQAQPSSSSSAAQISMGLTMQVATHSATASAALPTSAGFMMMPTPSSTVVSASNSAISHQPLAAVAAPAYASSSSSAASTSVATPARQSAPASSYSAGQSNSSITAVSASQANNADVNAKDNLGATKLHHAVRSNRMDEVRSLVIRGADINATSNKGLTPLMLAAYYGTSDVIRFLLANGAQINRKNKYDMAALHMAAQKNNSIIAEVLIQGTSTERADINAIDDNGRTALMYAAHFGASDVVRLLLANGADVRRLSKPNHTAYDVVLVELQKLGQPQTYEHPTITDQRNNFNAIKNLFIQNRANITGTQVLAERQQSSPASASSSSAQLPFTMSHLMAPAPMLSSASSSSAQFPMGIEQSNPQIIPHQTELTASVSSATSSQAQHHRESANPSANSVSQKAATTDVEDTSALFDTEQSEMHSSQQTQEPQAPMSMAEAEQSNNQMMMSFPSAFNELDSTQEPKFSEQDQSQVTHEEQATEENSSEANEVLINAIQGNDPEQIIALLEDELIAHLLQGQNGQNIISRAQALTRSFSSVSAYNNNVKIVEILEEAHQKIQMADSAPQEAATHSSELSDSEESETYDSQSTQEQQAGQVLAERQQSSSASASSSSAAAPTTQAVIAPVASSSSGSSSSVAAAIAPATESVTSTSASSSSTVTSIGDIWTILPQMIIDEVCVKSLREFGKAAPADLLETIKNKLKTLFSLPEILITRDALINNVLTILKRHLPDLINNADRDDFIIDLENALRTLLRRNDVKAQLEIILKLKAAAGYLQLKKKHDDQDGAAGATALPKKFVEKMQQIFSKNKHFEGVQWNTLPIKNIGTQALLSFGIHAALGKMRHGMSLPNSAATAA